MAIKKKLALYFSSDALSVVELERTKIVAHYHAPFDIFSKEVPQPSPSLTDEIRLTAVLQKTLRDYKIEIQDCFTALPTKDIILRSFFIPQMVPQEMAGAIEFEARKYIPFKLDELVYDYQVSKVKEAGQRKLRILFVGIRREILTKYLYILEQSGLKVMAIEPSPISLLRVLTQKKLLSSNHSCAVIEVDHEQGNIIILDRGLPQFIRDFKLMPPSASIAEEKDADSSFVRLLNEVKVSLDYYRRQFTEGVFDKVIFCSERDIKNWAESLQKELNLPVVYLKPQDILGSADNVDLGLVKAVGVGIKDYVNLPITINLSKKKVVQETKPTKMPRVAPLRINLIIRWLVFAAASVFLVYLFSSRSVWGLETQIKNVGKVSTKFSGKTSQELGVLIDETNKKISTLKELKEHKYFTPKFVAFAKLLPDGAWINSLEMRYNPADRSVNLTLNGSVYSPEIESHINIVNKFLDNLKKDERFSADFKAINLSYVNQTSNGEFRITNFEINCR